jgi:hypothetical protein
MHLELIKTINEIRGMSLSAVYTNIYVCISAWLAILQTGICVSFIIVTNCCMSEIFCGLKGTLPRVLAVYVLVYLLALKPGGF